MSFVPHTPAEIEAMCAQIGVTDPQQLFDEIDPKWRAGFADGLPQGLNEIQLLDEFTQRAAKDSGLICFAGGGAYDHHIPACVWPLVFRGEFYTAYTPYQAEASQGSLQLIYEYQSLMCALLAMPVSNASLYDGASACMEAILMAMRCQKKHPSRQVALAGNLSPRVKRVLVSLLAGRDLELVSLPFDARTGQLAEPARQQIEQQHYLAVVIAQPNYFGILESVDLLTDTAHQAGSYVIGLVNPLAMSVLKPPGQWGQTGADIVCGEGQPLGLPLASGGPYFGFLCARQKDIRHLPGRLVGKTKDADGRIGFTLTLQAREQHIRRGKAMSNICTNQGLMVAAATIYLTVMGPQGLQTVMRLAHQRQRQLLALLEQQLGWLPMFSGPSLYETVLSVPSSVALSARLEQAASAGFLAGVDISDDFALANQGLLICCSEKRSEQQCIDLVQALTC